MKLLFGHSMYFLSNYQVLFPQLKEVLPSTKTLLHSQGIYYNLYYYLLQV